jgi:hypothetical protein
MQPAEGSAGLVARWFAMSTGFLSDPKVERLIDHHGNDAVAVVVALMSQAMRQESAGEIELTYRTLGNESHTSKSTATAIVESAVDVGLLVLQRGDDYEFSARFPAWDRHQANYRQQKSRATRKANAQANVTDCHAGVTRVSPTRQTRQDKQKTLSSKDDQPAKDKKPTPARTVFDAWIKSTGKTSRTVFSDARRNLINRQLKAYSVDELVEAVYGWKFSPHHRGENDRGTVYDDIELLLKDAKNVEKFRDLTRAERDRRKPRAPQVIP